MREFKNYIPKNEEITEKRENVDEKKPNEQIKEKDIERMIEDRAGKSEGELMSELLESVRRAKAEGRFNIAELENFKKTVTPFLSSEQTKRLEEILSALE